MTADRGVLAVSVVICACGEVPWEQLRAAIGSVLSRQTRPAEVLLVVDRNENLAKRAGQELTGVTILGNRGVPGCQVPAIPGSGRRASRSRPFSTTTPRPAPAG